jgi:hypothetical protein
MSNTFELINLVIPNLAILFVFMGRNSCRVFHSTTRYRCSALEYETTKNFAIPIIQIFESKHQDICNYKWL